MYAIYVPSDRNDATSFYIDVIIASLEKEKIAYRYVENIKDILSSERVIVVSVKAFVAVLIHNPFQDISIWFQGIIPEENIMMFKGWNRYFKYCYNTVFEFLAIKLCKRALFVSQSMLKHYINKYGYNSNNYVIMPCFNQYIELEAFSDIKYQKPSFVYAGNMAEWQCIETTLQLFKQIIKQVPAATLTLLTNEQGKAKSLIEKYKLADVEIKYVPYKELNREMSKYKYGFLLRDDTPVNNVATPTKMNSYMACGVIPVFSNVIGDFKDQLSSLTYKVEVDTFENAINHIIAIESQKIIADEVKEEYVKVFSTYYAVDTYIPQIIKLLKT